MILPLLIACGFEEGSRSVVAVDGSSTVFPITEAVAEEFQKGRKARVTVGVSGTGGGFKKLCAGEIAIIGASRPIKPSEQEACAASGIGFIEVPVAYDGIVVATHPDNDWSDSITVTQLEKMWEPAAQDRIKRWNQVDTGWPDDELHLFGPGVDSGTYDYFTKAVVGTEHASRGDYTSSEDDNVIVTGVSTDPHALAFFGFAYYDANKARLKALAVDDGDPSNGEGPIEPTAATIADGSYQPLSRPIFIYVSEQAAGNRDVAAFVEYYLDNSAELASSVGYVPLQPAGQQSARKRFERRTTGSMFDGAGSQVGVTTADLQEANQ